MAREQRFSLREWRNIRHLTIEQMAKAMGVSTTTYSKWERNPRRVRLGDLVGIMTALDVSPQQVKLMIEEEEEEGNQEE